MNLKSVGLLLIAFCKTGPGILYQLVAILSLKNKSRDFIFRFIQLTCVSVLPVCFCNMWVLDAHRGQKLALDHLEHELQVVLSHHVSAGKWTLVVLTTEQSLYPPNTILHINNPERQMLRVTLVNCTIKETMNSSIWLYGLLSIFSRRLIISQCVNYSSTNLCQQKIADGCMRSVIIKQVLYPGQTQATRVNKHSCHCQPAFPPQCLSQSARKWFQVFRASDKNQQGKFYAPDFPFTLH